MANMKLGEMLLKVNAIREHQLKSALAEQQKWGGRLGDILVRMSLVTEELLVKALSKQLAIPAAQLDSVQSVPAAVKGRIPSATARELGVIPLQLRDEGKTLVVAMADPLNLIHLDTLHAVSRCKIVPQIAGKSALARAFVRVYQEEPEVNETDGSFKMLNSQGNTLVRASPEIAQVRAEYAAAEAVRAQAAAAAAAVPAERGPSLLDLDPIELLRAVEVVQRKEVAAIKAMVELMISKGVFTRDEYLAKVKR